jgi:hypothetical protein
MLGEPEFGRRRQAFHVEDQLRPQRYIWIPELARSRFVTRDEQAPAVLREIASVGELAPHPIVEHRLVAPEENRTFYALPQGLGEQQMIESSMDKTLRGATGEGVLSRAPTLIDPASTFSLKTLAGAFDRELLKRTTAHSNEMSCHEMQSKTKVLVSRASPATRTLRHGASCPALTRVFLFGQV